MTGTAPAESPASAGSRRDAVLRDAAVILGWFAVLGIVAGLVWWQVTPLAEWTRTKDSASMDERMLARPISVDGWFFLIAAVGGLVSGAVLTVWRTRDPVLTVILIAVGAGLASALMYLVGHQLGPGPLKEALEQASVGQKVPIPLAPAAHGVYLVWPVAAMFTSLAVLWGTNDRSANVPDHRTSSGGNG